MSKIFFSMLSLLIVTSSALGVVQLSHRETVGSYERKIIEKEKIWRVEKKITDDTASLNEWKSANGKISIAIFKRKSHQGALEELRGLKYSTSAGRGKDVKGLGDGAFEHIDMNGDVSAVLFVKGTTIVHVDTDSAKKLGAEILYKFARHVLDAMEGK
jgi:hypothetical protein